ncbi:hypothetical protein [Cellulomonas gilvus]|uniref:Elastase, putative n=1 Tax=Cellulomonas gilvus (strain ATCC 13127 / NRRL B-14078) TaxID=593907 RepID=F8A625_CELGA|nr:hypothetical protein [Cellulomonas gilvus]AEI11040.1 elastase, putative [Cellulomonas gilvus ATCC 13127]
MTKPQRMLRGFVGWRPTDEQVRVFDESRSRAAVAIQTFVSIMREEFGEEALPLDPIDARRP